MSTAARMACTLGKLTGSPSRAPFEIDDVQMLGAACSTNCRATAAGSSAKTVSCW